MESFHIDFIVLFHDTAFYFIQYIRIFDNNKESCYYQDNYKFGGK